MDESLDRVADDLRGDPRVTGLLAEALGLTGGDLERAVDLVMRRLRWGHPRDQQALADLVGAAVARTAAEALVIARLDAEMTGQCAEAVLAEAEALRARSRGVRRQVAEARAALRAARVVAHRRPIGPD